MLGGDARGWRRKEGELGPCRASPRKERPGNGRCRRCGGGSGPPAPRPTGGRPKTASTASRVASCPPSRAAAILAMAAVSGGVGRDDVEGEMRGGETPPPALRGGGEGGTPGAPAFADMALRWGGPGSPRPRAAVVGTGGGG